MRKVWMLAAVAAMMLMSSEAQASRRLIVRGQSAAPVRNEGVFSRLMELERRKNAAIRDMFRR